ncbi:hypothetical protein CRENBAI_017002 [Crenichthys baileyi]|uniref:Uncharacterized protein n=1 Tax=Crenichthys baileyi TaxID=28760 RepID=A0AAV9R1C8_9TELE
MAGVYIDSRDMVHSLQYNSETQGIATDKAGTAPAELEMALDRDDLKPIFCPKSQSLFHRVQLDPLEKDWLRCSAVGNVAAQRLLLVQEPGLVLKKVRIGN